MVTVLMDNTSGEGKSSDDFWRQSEVLLYSALISYICTCAPKAEQNFSMLCDMIGAMEIRENDPGFKNAVDMLFDALATDQPDHFSIRQYRKFLLAAGKTARSILISCGARLACFDIAEVREIMEYDELSLDTIGEEKTALFLITSDTSSTFDFISAMALTQMFNTLCTQADDIHGGRLPVHVRCLLDEAANIKIPDLQRLLAVIRSREISACLCIQAQSQLKAIYKDHADTITANCDSFLFLGGQEKGTLKDLSERLGQETIDLFNTSITKGSQESHGQNFQKLGKSLMSVDELAVLDGGRCILQLRGVRPFLSRKYDVTQHPNYKYTSDANPKNAFHIEKHLSTRLRLKPDDMVEVYDIELPEEAED